MLRVLLGWAVGMGLGGATIFGWQALSQVIFPFAPGLPLNDPDRRWALVNSASFLAQIWVMAGYPVGVAVGGVAANLIADARWPALTLAVTAAAIFLGTLTMHPHPLWMQVLGVGMPLLAGLAVAASVGRRTLVDA